MGKNVSKRNIFTLSAFLMLISVTSFSGTQGLKKEMQTGNTLEAYWTCYAVDSDEKTFPGLEKDKESALKTAKEKCSFFSDAADSCRLSEVECDFDEL